MSDLAECADQGRSRVRDDIDSLISTGDMAQESSPPPPPSPAPRLRAAEWPPPRSADDCGLEEDEGGGRGVLGEGERE